MTANAVMKFRPLGIFNFFTCEPAEQSIMRGHFFNVFCFHNENTYIKILISVQLAFVILLIHHFDLANKWIKLNHSLNLELPCLDNYEL